MKSIKKVTKLRLESNHADDVKLIGLVSADPDYKLSLSINRKLGISLKNSNPVTPDDTKERFFSRFIYTDENSSLAYSLLSNRSGKEFMVRQLKNVDYILCVNDPEKSCNFDSLLTDLRKTASVTAVFVIDSDSLKDRNIQHLIQ